jgi:predicted ABC-type ATPase
MLRKVNYLFDRREDFCIETTLATRALLKMTRSAQEKGYYVTVLYFWLNNPEIAIERVAKRVQAGGHDIPEETIRRRYQMGLNYLFHQYMQTCDKWILADNSNPPFEVIAEGSKKGLIIRDMAKYNIVRRMVTDNLQPQNTIENVTEFIAKEIAKAPLAHDGVPYQNDQTQNDQQ